ncbi:hypothetical protein EDB89DRAFT_1968905 [Lactarius sanguifluus]|nr:hypothetical protein EDB89DRAFT_1968905 [Lactarius sanguifluus]
MYPVARIPRLGRSSSQYHSHTEDVLYFAYSLRTLLRRYPRACASVSLPPNMSESDDNWGGRGWLNILSWLVDASVTLAGFSGESRECKRRCG